MPYKNPEDGIRWQRKYNKTAKKKQQWKVCYENKKKRQLLELINNLQANSV